MIKIFSILFLFFAFILQSYSNNDINIITREEWGANENYRYLDSLEWQNILKMREKNKKNNANISLPESEIIKHKKRQKKLKEIENILLNTFGSYRKLKSIKYSENGKTLAWPISKSKQIKAIVIHHTYTDYDSSLEGVRKIYKYHALTMQWGDIGYNFLIGKDGEIYEGRAGGDYVVAAHNKWNNRSTIGISIIGNYSKNKINEAQYNSLKKLTEYLIKKYNIDLTKKTYFHKECIGDSCRKALTSFLKYPIIGHRDAGNTEGPGDALYAQLNDLRSDIFKKTISVADLYKQKLYKKLSKYSDEKLLSILSNIEYGLDKEKKINKLKIKGILISYFKNKEIITGVSAFEREKLKGKIKIKLSYPYDDKIIIKTKKGLIDIKRKGNSVYFKGKKFDLLTVPSINGDILEIISWSRVPAWDKKNIYNDNKFRGDLIIYVKNNKLVVVNDIKIEDYLKGLGEISNNEKIEKAKTIIISARSYARWYITKARKFEGELYDGSDDPNVFQKYLGYGLEERSPNINKIVNDTKGKVITYNGELIKPWYFSASSGKTISFYDYCNIRYSDKICSREAKKYPYLQSVKDYGSNGENKGHGVGISGTGVRYFADRGWTSDMIIKYFLKGVEVF